LIGAEEHAPRHVLLWDHNNQHYYATAAEVDDARRPEASRHYRYFYDPLSEDGFLSNHFQKEVAFRTVGGECCRAKSSEHLFMYLKALVFGDLGAAESILQAPTPQAAKQAARLIAPFVQFTWDCNKRETMLQALRLKFAFDSAEADALVATHPAILAEAAPSDLVWGIGLSTEEAQAGAAWRGANVLGHCLMRRRWELMTQASDTAPGASDSVSLTLQDVKPSDASAAADRLGTGKRGYTPKAEPQRREGGAAFTYVDVFAGTSAFTEKALALHGEAIGFVESDTSDHPLLRALCPSAWIASDLYGDEWQTQHYRAADALLAWPMCKHLAACGLGRMQHDEVASQLWDIAPLAEYFNVELVAIENSPWLEWLDHEHGLLEHALHVFEVHGFSLAAVWHLQDIKLGGGAWRQRPWILLERTELTGRLAPLYQPESFLQPVTMRAALDCEADIAPLRVRGVLAAVPAGWTPGSFTLEWSRPLQPGTSVMLDDGRTYCVLQDHTDHLRLRRDDPRDPEVLPWVTFERISPSGLLTQVRSIDSPCHTMRSSPDPPGNCLILETRFHEPFVRSLSADEQWRIQGRCEKQLRLLHSTGVAPSGIVHKAGKAITGAMATFMAETLASRVPQLRASKRGCLSPHAEPAGAQVLVVVIAVAQQMALVACEGEMLPGYSLRATRESAVSLALRFSKECTGAPLPTFLVGQEDRGDYQRWTVACPVNTTVQLLEPWAATLDWLSFKSLQGTHSWDAVLASHVRLCEFTNAAPIKAASGRPRPQTGKFTTRLASSNSSVSKVPWPEVCKHADEATRALRSAFWSAAQSAPTKDEADAMLAWHCKIEDFEQGELPELLRARLPLCAGLSATPFPEPHEPESTLWLPLKTAQPRLRRQVHHWSELLEEHSFNAFQTFLAQQASWLKGIGQRPPALAISELHFVEWARGTVLDLRHLPEVRELDYTAHTPTKFNTGAIQAALEFYPDQEMVSFMVLGASYKAELPHQLVLNHHLMNMVGRHEEVFLEMQELTASELGWSEVFDALPFLPARVNGKGQVPKGLGVRPIEECGPRVHTLDSAGDLVLALNDYSNGVELYHHLIPRGDAPTAATASVDREAGKKATPAPQCESDELSALKAEARAKWIHESKPRVKSVRQANSILKEPADLSGQGLYVFSADWFKCFNQYMLRPEDYWKCLNAIFDDSFMANYCMTFGISPASNIAQRGANAFIWFFLREFAKLDAPHLAADAGKHPALEAWLSDRRRLGPRQATLLWMCCYTDDPLWLVVGADRVVRAAKLYKCINHLFGLIPAHPKKHNMGLHASWLGIKHLALLGITLIPDAKVAKALTSCVEALAGNLTNT
jgi:hypothetical protein